MVIFWYLNFCSVSSRILVNPSIHPSIHPEGVMGFGYWDNKLSFEVLLFAFYAIFTACTFIALHLSDSLQIK